MDTEPQSSNNETSRIGSQLSSILTEEGLSSLRPRIENLGTLQGIDSVIFVGSTATGKSTLVDAIRESNKTDPELSGFSIPKRVITRPPRENDNLAENDFVSNEEFEQMVSDGKIGLHFVRKMEHERTERYGFLQPQEGTTPVYSANNAVINNRESVKPEGILDRALIVAVYSPEVERNERLPERSPDLVRDKPDEVDYRLSDKAANMYPYAHIVVKNFGKYLSRSKEDVVTLMKLVGKVGK